MEVHGHAKQGAGFGSTAVRGLNALIAAACTGQAVPVIVAQRLRQGACGSARGAARLVADALSTLRRLWSGTAGWVLVRADSAFYGCPTIAAALRAGAQVSVTVRLTAPVKTAIAGIDQDAWQPIEYTDAVFDEQTGRWISRAEVAECGEDPECRRLARPGGPEHGEHHAGSPPKSMPASAVVRPNLFTRPWSETRNP